MSDHPTCGVLYLQAMKHFTEMDRMRLADFSAGFTTGQVEKVYLGACAAAMFRPSPEFQDMIREELHFLCALYGLEYFILDGESWIYRQDNTAALAMLETIADLTPLAPLWHALRGLLCGIPNQELDVRYHERPGYGEPADRAPSAADGVASNAMATIDMSWTGGRAVAQCGRCLQDMPDGHFEIHEGIGLCPACAAEIAPSRDS